VAADRSSVCARSMHCAWLVCQQLMDSVDIKVAMEEFVSRSDWQNCIYTVLMCRLVAKHNT